MFTMAKRSVKAFNWKSIFTESGEIMTKESYIKVFGEEFEYDFLSGWLKYLRLKSGYSQEYLSKGICSKSHLSYFENGKKRLRPEVVESLLEKLGMKEIPNLRAIGHIRKMFYDMIGAIEFNSLDDANNIYNELRTYENILRVSPYNIESKIFMMYYDFFVLKQEYHQLEAEIRAIDKIYSSLNMELKHHFMFVSGRIYYKYKSHEEGINRLEESGRIKSTPIGNYYLGFAYSFDDQPIKGVYFLEKALKSYTEAGRFSNALWCNNNLGICYVHLKMYNRAKDYYEAALNGATYFGLDKILGHVHVNLSDVYLKMGDYKNAMVWAEKSIETSKDPILPVVNCVDIYSRLGLKQKIKDMFDTYLVEEHKPSRYFKLLEFHFLRIYHKDQDIFQERVVKDILPYYRQINYIALCDEIRYELVGYYEKNRKYKEANKLYKEILRNDQ